MCLSSSIPKLRLISLAGAQEISPHAVTARRVIAILSPASLGNVWSDTNVGLVLKQLSCLPTTRTIVVTLKDLPSITSITKSTRRAGRHVGGKCDLDKLKILHWDDGGGAGAGGYKFWYKLRLAMPAARPLSNPDCHSVAMIVQANSSSTSSTNSCGKSSQQKARSRESLEVLV